MLLIIAIAWMYVAVLMAVAQACSPNGSVLGAIATLLLYGVGPLALVMYVLGTPARRKARRLRDHQELQHRTTEPSAANPDGRAHATRDAPITSERIEP